MIPMKLSVAWPVARTGCRQLATAWLGTALMIALASACTDDQPVIGPKCDGPCTDAAVENDAQVEVGGEVALVSPVVNFYAETKIGNVLEGTTDTAQVDGKNDLFADAGVQLNFVVQTTNAPDGSTVALTVGGTAVGNGAVIKSGSARFDKVTLPCTNGTATAIAVSVVTPQKLDGQKTKNLQVACADACKASLVAAPACLTDDADPGTDGFQFTFTVKTDTPDCTHAYIKGTDAEGNPLVSQKIALAGAASVPVKVTLSSKAKGLSGAIAKVSAVVEDQTGSRPQGESPVQVVTITTELPEIVITAPAAGLLTLADDLDANAPGIQVVLKGTATTLTPADTNAVEISADDTATVQTTVQADGSFQVPLTFAANKSYKVKVTAKNTCGLVGAASAVYNVFASKATLAISGPAPGSVLLAKDDTNPATAEAYDVTLTVDVANGTPDSDISIYCRKNALGATFGSKPVGVGKYSSGGSASVAVTIDTVTYSTAVACIAKDNAPNAAESGEAAFTLALPAPCLTVASPAAAAVVTAYDVPLVIDAKNLEGSEVTLYLQSQSGVVFDPVAVGKVKGNGLVGSLSLKPAGQALLDGVYTFSVDATDSFGNHAAVSLCSDATRTLTLDTTGPTVEIALPSKATLTTLDDPDAAPAKPGYQVDVTVTIADAVEVCIDASSGDKVCQKTLPTDTKVVFAGITLQPGLNTINVSAKDAAGNQSAGSPWIGTLVSDAPIVKLVNPAASFSTIADSQVFVASVTKVGGAAVTGAVTQVLIDGVQMPIAVTETAPGQYQFTVTGLSAKPSTKVHFGAAASGSVDKVGFSQEITVTFKTVKPAIAIKAPADKAVFNLASPQCLAGSTDCLTTVTASTTDIEDGAKAELTVTCGTALPFTATATVANNAVSFANAALKDQNVCKLQAKATDLAGQVALSAEITATVDRVAPVFANLASPNKGGAKQFILFAADDLNGNPADGAQVNVQMQVTGLEAGQIGTLVVDDGAKKSFQATLPGPLPPSGKGTLNFGVLDFAESASTTLTFTMADAAGNSVQTVYSIQVVVKQASVVVGAPTNNSEGNSCATSATCGGSLCVGGKCVVGWNASSSRKVAVFVTGVPAGGVVNLCVSGVAVSGADCGTAGFKLVSTAKLPAGGQIDMPADKVPDGMAVFMAESSFLPDVPLTSSLKAPLALSKQRTVLIDSVAPKVLALTPPAAPNAAAACLNEASQSKADGGQLGGSFAFGVTTDEEGAVTLAGAGTFGTSATASKAATVTLALASEGTVTFSATATDLVGNVSSAVTVDRVVDTQKPTGAFQSPAGAKVLAVDSQDVVVVSQSADAEGQDVAIKDGGTAKGTEKLMSGAATFTKAKYGLLTDGDHTLQADVRDLCGNVATVGTNPSKVSVDTQPPTVAFTAPAQGATFGDSQDANSVDAGYQVGWAITVGDTASYKIELGDGCDSNFANCTYKQVDAGTAGGTVISSNKMTIPFGASTAYSIRATVTDASGNTAVATRGFKVVLSGCLVSLKGLSATGAFNNSACATPNADCASISANLTAEFFGPCGTVANVQLKKGGTEVAKKAPTGSTAAFTVTVNDGDNTTIEAIVLDAGNANKGSSGPLALKADLTSPKVSFVAGTVLSVKTLAGPGPQLVGKAGDLNGQGGHQLHLQVGVTDSGLVGGKLVKLERTVGATTAALAVSQPNSLPLALNATSATVDVQFAALQEDATNTVTATVTDAAGNTGTGKIVIVVDWTAPAAVSLAAFKAGDLNPRRPSAKLSFTASGDNGNTGTASKYLVRYSNSPINNQTDFDKACDAAKLPATTIASPAAAGTAQTISVDGPDPRPNSSASPDPCKYAPLTDNGSSAWHFAVQVQDAAGNVSAVSNDLSTIELRLRYAKITYSGTGTNSDMQSRVQKVGDVNGDGLGDFAIGGGASAPLCIIYGRNQASLAAIAINTDVPASYPSYVCMANSGGLGAPIGRGGDVNGDGVDDLVVGSGTGSGVPRSVLVYLGKKNAALGSTPVMTIKDIVGNSAVAYGVWRVQTIGNFNGDTANGKPIHDIALTSRNGVITYDRVIIVPGSASWNESSPKTISIDSAPDRAANNVATVRLSDSSGSPIFGHGLFGVGNLLTDSGATQYDDLAIGQSATPQALYVLKGRPLSGDTDIALSTTSTNPADATAVAIRNLTTPVGINQLGVFTDAGQIDGDGVIDLVFQHQASNGMGAIYWMKGAYLASQLGKVVNLATETLLPGQTDAYSLTGGYSVHQWNWGLAALGNFADRQGTGGPFIDFVHGVPNFPAAGGTTKVTIRHGLVRPQSAIAADANLQYEDIVITDPFNANKATWGVSTNTGWGGIGFAPLGDFNGDGLVDLCIGSVDGSFVVVY